MVGHQVWLAIRYGSRSGMTRSHVWLALMYGSRSCMACSHVWLALMYGSLSCMARFHVWLATMYGPLSGLARIGGFLLEVRAPPDLDSNLGSLSSRLYPVQTMLPRQKYLDMHSEMASNSLVGAKRALPRAGRRLKQPVAAWQHSEVSMAFPRYLPCLQLLATGC
jgi:hypothetical protein